MLRDFVCIYYGDCVYYAVTNRQLYLSIKKKKIIIIINNNNNKIITKTNNNIFA